MSDVTFWDDDGGSPQQESNGMRALREKAEADSRRLQELHDMVGTLSTELNRERVEKVITSKGFDPSVAGLLLDAKVEPTPAAVEAFLTKHAALLVKPVSSVDQGEPTTTGQAAPVSTVPTGEQAALAAQAAAAAGSTPQLGIDAVDTKLKSFDSADELMAFIKGSGL